MGKVDTILFTKKIGKDLFVLQIYVDDIIFGSTNQEFYEEFGKMMASEFEMSVCLHQILEWAVGTWNLGNIMKTALLTESTHV